MSMSRPGRVVALVAVAAALLAGCGSARPGVAVQVGDETISSNRVDELSSEYCRAIERQLTGNNQQVPQRYFRSGIASTLTMRSIAAQLADDYDVKPGKVYDQKLAELNQSTEVLEEDVREAVLEVESSPAYVEAIQAAVGKVLLDQESAAASEYSEQIARGTTAFEDWISENGVDFDPSLGISMVKGKVQSTETGLSVAVGESALKGGSEEPDAEYAAALPDSHRCG